MICRSTARRTRALALVALFACACQGTRNLQDPTLVVQTDAGSELGVSTEYGVVFLGRSAPAGDVDITAFFGDGPSTEKTTIEPLGGGLYTAEVEIRLPSVPLHFERLERGDEVLIIGRRDGEAWQVPAAVKTDPRVEGLLLSIPSELRNAPDQVGAGVFILFGSRWNKRLVGLVSGTLELVGADGERRAYLTVVGADELWRLVARRKEIERKRRWVYREDVL